MTLVAASLGFAAALVLVLGWSVVTLRRDMRALVQELTELKQRPPVVEPVEVPPPVPVVKPVSPVAREPQTIFPAPGEDTGRDLASVSQDESDLLGDPGACDEPSPEAEHVAVITRMSDPVDVDLTTRRVASVTLARPLIKVASLSYGLRRALDDEHRFRVRWTMRQELKRQRKMRRRRNRAQAPSQGWRS